jgi:hypothetical protein
MDEATMHAIIPVFLVLFLIAAGTSQQVLRYKVRVLIHKERLLAIERGIDFPSDPGQTPGLSPQVCLLRGLLWLFMGIALIICLLMVATFLRGDDRSIATAWAMAGIVPAGIGLAYLLYYRLQQKI